MRKYRLSIQPLLLFVISCAISSSVATASIPGSHFSISSLMNELELWKDVSTFPITDQPRGDSTATLVQDDSSAVFAGELKPVKSPAYASYRIQKTNFAAWDFREVDEITFFVVGDGRKYRLILRDATAYQSATDYSFQNEFQTISGVRQEIKLKVTEFVPYFRGIQMPDDVVLDRARIVQWGLQVTDITAGSYRLLIETR